MQICSKCLLSDNIPSVRIGDDGLCNYCSAPREKQRDYPETDSEFEAILYKYKDRRYQVVMAYSGGKDSTYTIKLMKEKYKASILAITFNNGFISDTRLKNINTVTDFLGIDSIIVKYPADKMLSAFRLACGGGIFPAPSLERASSICNLCITFIKNLLYYEAIIRYIPIICFGWTPGQVSAVKPLIKLDYRMVSKMFGNVRNAVTRKCGDRYGNYFLDGQFLKEHRERIPTLYYPFVNNPYNEGKILDEIRKIGWEMPQNTDGNSSNCLLNSYANQCHMSRFGYHPYAFEISSMIRHGFMTREEGAAKLKNTGDDSQLESIRRKFQDI